MCVCVCVCGWVDVRACVSASLSLCRAVGPFLSFPLAWVLSALSVSYMYLLGLLDGAFVGKLFG